MKVVNSPCGLTKKVVEFQKVYIVRSVKGFKKNWYWGTLIDKWSKSQSKSACRNLQAAVCCRSDAVSNERKCTMLGGCVTGVAMRQHSTSEEWWWGVGDAVMTDKMQETRVGSCHRRTSQYSPLHNPSLRLAFISCTIFFLFPRLFIILFISIIYLVLTLHTTFFLIIFSLVLHAVILTVFFLYLSFNILSLFSFL